MERAEIQTDFHLSVGRCFHERQPAAEDLVVVACAARSCFRDVRPGGKIRNGLRRFGARRDVLSDKIEACSVLLTAYDSVARRVVGECRHLIGALQNTHERQIASAVGPNRLLGLQAITVHEDHTRAVFAAHIA
jgi:hypothetical protein